MSGKVLVAICARGGSKGCPGKHLRMICGKSLIAWTVDQAMSWGKGRVVLSSDDNNILEVGYRLGVTILLRPADLAGDDVGKVPVIRHATQEMESKFGVVFDCVVDLDATAPIRTVQDIEDCYTKFMAYRPKTLFTVTKPERSPYFNILEGDQRNPTTIFDPDLSKPKWYRQSKVLCRQAAPQVWAANSCIYVYKRDWLTSGASESCLTDDTILHVMDDESFYHVDSELDFFIVKQLMRRRVGG